MQNWEAEWESRCSKLSFHFLPRKLATRDGSVHRLFLPFGQTKLMMMMPEQTLTILEQIPDDKHVQTENHKHGPTEAM